MFKRLLGAALAALTVFSAAPSLASVVVFSGSGDTATMNLEHIDLPGSGVYVLQAQFDGPVSFGADGRYTQHWDVFRAPPPREHGEYVEGNDFPRSFGVTGGYGSSFSGMFVVPRTFRYFFTAADQYEYRGVAPGTPLYYEERYEDPYFWLSVFDEYGLSSRYSVTITQVAQVPEPTTWALLMLGFGLVGAAVRHRPAAAPPPRV